MNKTQKFITIISVVAIMLTLGRRQANALELTSKSSARLVSTTPISIAFDYRAQILEGFLLQYDSPMAPYAKDFVKYADEYNLDWRLVASIAGLESGFGLHIPYKSYNGWGWGVYGDNVINFTSWSDGIETISDGLRTAYLKDIEYSDPYIIGPTYAASPTWAQRVTYFMNRMEEYRLRHGKSYLTLTI